ncbi:hypothetical protein BH11MYX2_BH11MYX2_04570 [soil metagenome]
MDIVKLLYQPWTRRVARRVLVGRLRVRGAPDRGRFTKDDVGRYLTVAWHDYAAKQPKLTPQPTAGSTMNVRLACFTLAFFDALLAEGIRRDYAVELVADAAWGIYGVWGRLASQLARLKPGNRAALGFATTAKGKEAGVTLSFPFNAQGYLVKLAKVERGTGFDVVHCPVASYFREHDAIDLCVAAWCNLDYPLGEMTRQRLVRTQTIVQGTDHCDFRILPAESTKPDDKGEHVRAPLQ